MPDREWLIEFDRGGCPSVVSGPPGLDEEVRVREVVEAGAPTDYDPQAAMLAVLRAGNRVRGGHMHWLRGAPTHVLAELLTELQNDGWTLSRASSPSREDGER